MTINDLDDGSVAGGGSSMLITGCVLNQNRQPLPGVQVRVFSVRLREESLAGEAITGEDGRYSIESERPEALRVRVFDDSGELASSPVRFPMLDTEEFDFTVESSIIVPSEYERDLASVQAVLDGLDLHDVTADDLSFVAHETGIVEAQLDDLVQAVRRSSGDERLRRVAPGVPSAAWYAWRRHGFDVDDPALWERSLDELITTITSAAEAGVVPMSLRDNEDELRSKVRALRAEQLLNRQPIAGGGTVRDLLATLPEPLPADDQRIVAEALSDRRPSTSRLGDLLREANLTPEAADVAIRTVKLAELAEGQAPTVGTLQERAGDGTSLIGLAELSPDEWLDLAYRHGTPADDSPQAYATRMQTRIETLHPTATLKARLAAGSIRLPVPGGDRVRPFLDDHPEFDIATTPIDAAIETLPDDEVGRTELAQALKTVRRIGSVTTGWGHMDALLHRGIDSVERIAGMEPAYFASAVAGAIDPADAQIIVEQAQIVQQTTAALVGVLRTASAQGIEVIGHPVETSTDRHPSLRALFGPLDSCECGQCRSLLSPAAYLVELLNFVQQGSSLAFNALLARRPDLVDLDLSCANGEVEIPAVDVALEVLENAVALPLRIELPPGADLDAELTRDPLPDEIVAVLKRTARDVAGSLRALREPQELQQEGFSAWTITDRDRRWTVHARPGALTVGSSAFASRRVSFAGLDMARVAQDLDAGTLPPLLDGRIRDSMSAEPIWQAVEGPLSVSVIEAGRRWGVSFLFRVNKPPVVLNANGDASLTLTTAAGAPLVDKAYSPDAVAVTVSELAGGRFGGLLPLLLPPPDDLRVEAGPVAESLVAWVVLRFELSYAPRSLSVAALTYQSVSGQDLTAEPRNRNPAAYEVLRAASFPWTLPLNLPETESRALLERAGVSRRRLLELLLAAGAFTSPVVARETLGLSPEQSAQITIANTDPAIWTIWGLSVDSRGMVSIIDASTTETVTDTPASVLARVSILMQQAALTHQEVLDVATSAFVHGPGGAPQVLPAAECVPSKLRLEPAGAGFFDRFHRFVRLWRALGWTVTEVDAALGAFAAGGAVTEDVLRQLSHLVRLHEDTALSIAELISWYTAGGPSGLPAGERTAAIRRGLGLDDADYQRALRLTGLNPLIGPGETRLLFSALDVVRTGGFTLRELCYLGRHRLDITSPADEPVFSEAGLGIALSDTQINTILSGFRAALAATRDGGNLDNPDAAGALANLGWYPVLIAWILAELRADLSDPSVPADVSAVRRRRARLARRLRWATLPRLVSQFSAGFDPEMVVPAGFAGRIRMEPGDSASQTRIVVDGWLDPQDTAVLQPILGGAATGALDALVAQSDNWPDPPVSDRLLSEAALGQLYAPGGTFEDRVSVLMRAVVRRQQMAAGAAYLEQVLQQPAELIRVALFDLLADPVDTAVPPRSAFDALLAPDFVSVDPRTVLDPSQSPAQFAVIRKLSKVCVIAGRTGLQIQQLRAFQGTGPAVTGRAGGLAVMDLNQLPCGVSGDTAAPVGSWLQLMAFVALRRRNPGGAAMINAYVDALMVSGASDDACRSAALSVIASSVKQALPQVRAAAAQIEISSVRYREPAYVQDLLRLLDALGRLRATVSQAATLVTDGLSADQAEAAAQLAYSLLRGRYSDAAWEDVIRPVSDTLRVRQRDALVAYLLHRDRLTTADALYERYLIDTQSAPELITTRLLVATEAIQLFVNRCLLNLEPGVPPGTINRAQWEWMKAYRVWEAARKVFLRPQHWLRPELRLDASGAFQEVQSALAQSEASPEGAHTALLGYLDDLVELSQITILGVYEDDHTRTGKTDLYLVGRRANPPHRYYWRVCDDAGGLAQRWKPWQRVDLDVTGSHVLPFVLNGDLHLAWATFRKNQSQPPGEWEVQIAWAKRTSRGWTEKKVSPDTVVVPALPMIDEHRTFSFRVTHTERADPNIPAIPGIPDATYRLPVAQVDMLVAHDAAADPYRSRPDVASSAGTGVGTLMFTCEVLFEDVSGARWPAAGVGLLLSLGVAPVAAYQTPATGQVSQSFSQWPPFLVAVRFPQIPPNDINVDASVNGTKVGDRSYPRADSFAHPNKRWDVQIVVRAPEGVTAPSQVVDPERFLQYEMRGSFDVYADRDARYQARLAAITTSEPNPTLRGQPYDTGFRENTPASTPANDGLGLRFQPGYRFQQVFAATPGRFRLVQGARDRNGYWHYQDDVTQCLFRLLDDGRMVVVANSQRLQTRFRALASRSASDLYASSTQHLSDHGQAIMLVNRPTAGLLVTASEAAIPQPSILEQGVTFDRNSPNGDSSWETFFHLPLLMAEHLRQEQRYAEAQEWLRFVFDPTSAEARQAPQFDPRLYWQFRPFREASIPDRIEDLVTWLADPFVANAAKTAFQNQIEQWRDHPFELHEIARLRIGAYEWQVVLAYLKNLLDWADDAFRRETREALVEALMLYIEAANLLGPRPGRSPSSLTPEARSYRALKGRWDQFGNAWYSAADSPFLKTILDYIADLRAKGVPNLPSPAQVIAQLSTIGVTYFCVPPDDVLQEYWDRLEDRLFKIRHSQNIDGVERQLAFYPPPIDPALLVEAVAAGVDISQAVAQANAPLSPYRFAVLAQKATELCSELKSLGSLTLSALEKQDGERLARIRSDQEVSLLALVEQVRIEQVNDADANLTAVRASRESVASRYRYLQYLLTGQPGKEPAEGTDISEAPANLAFAPTSADQQDVPGLGLLVAEGDRFRQLTSARDALREAEIAKLVAPIFFTLGSYFATSFLQGLGHTANALADLLTFGTADANASGIRDEVIGSYRRRRDEWVAQSNAALRELAQIDKQVVVAQIRKGIADKELANHRQQMSNADAIGTFMRSKYSSTELYTFMSGQLGTVYFSAYQLALDVARQAEQAFRYELAQSDTFIRLRHWDSMRRGLLAGEQLAQDLKRMEIAYFNRNRREHELAHDISLRQLDPGALLDLRANGSCTFEVPEWLFDLRSPGHYLRRIKNVSLSLPCVAGPHTAVHVRLTLLHSEVRRSATAAGAYPRATAGDNREDTRFADDYALAETVVTSGTVEAPGVWEQGLGGDRRMPYEGRGAISTWRLELPAEFPAFEYESITDAVLTMRYSARDGDTQLRDAAVGALAAATANTAATPHALLISLHQDFPTQWSRLTASGDGQRTQKIDVARNRLPYFATAATGVTIKRIDAFGVASDRSAATADLTWPALTIAGQDVDIDEEAPIGLLARGIAKNLSLAVPASPDADGATWTISAQAGELRAFTDVFFVVTYSAKMPDPGGPP